MIEVPHLPFNFAGMCHCKAKTPSDKGSLDAQSHRHPLRAQPRMLLVSAPQKETFGSTVKARGVCRT